MNTLIFTDIAVDSTGIKVYESDDRICSIEKNSVSVADADFGYSVIFDSKYGTTVESIYNVAYGTPLMEHNAPERVGFIFDGCTKTRDTLKHGISVRI